MNKRIASLGILLLCASTGLALDDDFKREGGDRAQKDRLEGLAPPALTVTDWLNSGGQAIDLASLKGKVVVLDFWGTWWGPCRSAIPKLEELHSRYQDQGLVLIGVHTTRQGEKMADYAKEKQISYPIAIDVDEKTQNAFAVDSFPDYYVIDRAGKLRVADLANAELERVVQVLLAEGQSLPAPLAEAAATAKKKDQRILVVWGTEDERRPLEEALKNDRALGKFVRNEFERVSLERAEHGELARKEQVGDVGLALTVLDAGGLRLATLDARGFVTETGLDTTAFRGFLEQHRVPQRDAEVLWSQALARADKENKRILVHLGAPWWPWCFKLEEFLGQPEVATLLSRDYIDLKIDTERHLNGAEVAGRLRGDEPGGIPWTVITDSTGAALITSDGPEGNIGCPVSESETAWFMGMISKTARNLGEAEIAKLDALLEEFAKQYRR